MVDRFEPRLAPPSVSDARGRAFAETARRAAAEPEFRRLLLERIDDVPAGLLPYLVREFGLHKFVEPGMPEETIRRMLKGSFDLHKEIGYIRGVSYGLSLLGFRIVSWTQWFRRVPMGAPGTHRVRLAFDEAIFPGDGTAITVRMRRAVSRMVHNTKRASQDVGVEMKSAGDSAAIYVGMAIATRLEFRMAAGPRTRLHGDGPVYVGAAFVSRVRCKMGI